MQTVSLDENYPECDWRHLAAQSVMLGTHSAGHRKQKNERRIIETSISAIDQLTMPPDPTIHRVIDIVKATVVEFIGRAMLEGDDLTEDEAKRGLLYLDGSRKISEASGAVENALRSKLHVSKFKAVCIKKFGAQEAFGKPETKERILEGFRISGG
jgi:hypothetical protein